MPSIPLFPPSKRLSSLGPSNYSSHGRNPLPPLLQTPSGLAILEIQGTLNFPTSVPDEDDDDADADTEMQEDQTETHSKKKIIETELGKITFPDYSDISDPESTKWMKRVYLYAGRYQRMTGEVKKLPKPLAIIQRRQQGEQSSDADLAHNTNSQPDELEIVDVIKYKIIFASRPEPVGSQ